MQRCITIPHLRTMANSSIGLFDNLQIDSNWIFRVDADEVVTPELAQEIIESCRLHKDDDVNAFEMRFKVYFLGRFLKHGGAYPFCKINIFKKSKSSFQRKTIR